MSSPDPAPCPTCGALTPHGARFCPRCGDGLVVPVGREATRDVWRSAGVVAAVVAAVVVAALLVTGAGTLPELTGSPFGPTAGVAEVALPERGASDPEGGASEFEGSASDPERGAPDAEPGDIAPDPGPGLPAQDVDDTGAQPDWVSCRSEAGPVRCVASVARITIAPDDAVQVLDSGIVVADDDGGVRLHGAGDGAERWRARLRPPLRVHGLVAGTIAVGSAEGVHFLDVDGGAEIGLHRAGIVDAVPNGPWLVVARGDGTVAAVSVTGELSWVRNVAADGRAWLTEAGSYLEDADGVVRALYPNTGSDRWAVDVRGTVSAIHRSGKRTMVVLDDPPSTVTIDDTGEILLASVLDGGQVTWSGLHPAGDRVVTVTHHAAAFSTLSVTSMETGEILATADTRGRTGEVAPVLAGDVAALPLVGARPQLRLIDLTTGGVRGLYSIGAPFAAVGFPDERTIALLDDRGTVTVHAVDPQHERYRVAFGRDAALLAGGVLRVRSGTGITTLDAGAGA